MQVNKEASQNAAIIASQKTRRNARLAQIPSVSLRAGSSLGKKRLFQDDNQAQSGYCIPKPRPGRRRSITPRTVSTATKYRVVARLGCGGKLPAKKT
jgi:hypothetical protein